MDVEGTFNEIFRLKREYNGNCVDIYAKVHNIIYGYDKPPAGVDIEIYNDIIESIRQEIVYEALIKQGYRYECVTDKITKQGE